MDNVERYLHDRLHAKADRIPVPAGDLDAVVTRGRRRRGRGRVTAGAAAALATATAVATVVGLQQGGGSTHRITVSAGPPAPGATSAALNWKLATPGDGTGLGYLNSLAPVESGGTVYALSSAPGQAQNVSPFLPPTLYQSSDGVSWTTATGPNGLVLADLAAVGNDVYAVGTGTAVSSVPNEHGGGDLSTVGVSSSSRGSASWTTANLPIDFAAIGQVATTNGAEVAHVAASKQGIIAAATVNANLDLSKLTAIPPAQRNAQGWEITTQGITLLTSGCANRAPETVAGGSSVACYDRTTPGPRIISSSQIAEGSPSYTWAELNITGDALRAVLNEPFVFYSHDGTDFSPVTLPAGAQAAWQLGVAAGPTEFAVTGFSVTTNSTGVWISPDGTTWSPAPPLPPAVDNNEVAAGYLNNQLTLVENGYQGPTSSSLSAVVTLTNGAWNIETIPGLESFALTSAAIGPLGIAVGAIAVTNPPVTGPPTSAAPSAVPPTTIPPTAVPPTTIPPTAVPPTTIPPTAVPPTSVSPDTAAPSTVSPTSVSPDTAAPSTVSPTSVSPDTAAPTREVAFSPDGTTWSTSDLAALSGGPVGNINNISVTAKQVVVTAQRPGSTAEFSLIGTAR